MEEMKHRKSLVMTVTELKLLCQGFMIGNEDDAMKRSIDFKLWCDKYVQIEGLDINTVNNIIFNEVYSPQFKYGDDEATRRYRIPDPFMDNIEREYNRAERMRRK